MGLFDGGDANKNLARKGNKAQNKHQKKAKKAIRQGERKATAALNTARTEAVGAVKAGTAQGREDIQAGLSSAQDYYAPLQQAASKGSELYGNFFGLGGAEGQAQAQENWQGSPLYQSMVGEASLGQQALDRQANARGNPYNGTDTLQYQGQLAGKYLNDYTAGLRPYLDQGLNIANNQANMAYGAGGLLAGQQMQSGLGQANIHTGLGTTQATGVNMPAGMGVAQVQQNMGQSEADMYANIAAAGNTANQNKWGMLSAGLGAAGTLGGAYLGKK
jgi:hypothetical protein